FFLTDTATTEIYTLSLHDALPIWMQFRNLFLVLVAGLAFSVGMIGWLLGRSIVTPLQRLTRAAERIAAGKLEVQLPVARRDEVRSEEHTSELQSRENLVCRLLLEK